jgi:hypothetical protein
MNEEILRVLDMVKEGKITTQEGENLISAITGGGEKGNKKAKYSMLRVRVDARDPEKNENAKVNVNIPLSIAKKAASLVAFTPKDVKKDLLEKGIDLDAMNIPELIGMFEDGEITEELVTVEAGDETKGATVRVYVD